MNKIVGTVSFKKFTDEKEPYVSVIPTYESTGCFPNTEEEREDNEDED